MSTDTYSGASVRRVAVAAAFDGLRRNAILLAETIEGMDLLEAQGGADEIVG